MSKLKIGIIGCGGIANDKHMPSMAKQSEVSLVAFCDIIPERAEKAAAEYGAQTQRYTLITASCWKTRTFMQYMY